MSSNSGNLIVTIVAIGMGLSFVWADPKSPISRALALGLCALGVVPFLDMSHDAGVLRGWDRLWTRAFSIGGSAAIITLMEWLLRVARTEPSGNGARAEYWLRVCQTLAGLYGLTGVLFPRLREDAFMSAYQPEALLTPGYYLFAGPLYLSVGLAAMPFVSIFLVTGWARSRPKEETTQWI
jgi:hypothetical protein